MALVVGLDIGTRTLKGAVFTGSPGKFQLVDFFVEAIPHLDDPVEDGTQDAAGELESSETLDALIARVLAERNLRSADVIIGADTKDCVIREITVPFTREDQIRKTVPFEAENYFHAFDVEDVVLEYVKVGEAEGRSRLILMALKNSLISERLELLKRASCDPVSIDLDGAALLNAFAATPYFDEERSTLILDLGATSSKIVLVENGRLKKIRSLRMGGEVLGPDRLIAAPAKPDEGSSEGGGTLSEEDSLEARFQEIERALQRLDPADEAPEASEQEGLPNDDSQTPIAIIPDEDYHRLRKAIRDELGEKAGEVLPEEGLGDGETAGAEGADGALLEDDGADLEDDGASARFPGGKLDKQQSLDYQEFLERVGAEIQRTFATTPLASPIELICVTGGLGYREETRRYFSEEFDVDAVLLDFGGTLPSDLEASRMEQVSSEGAVSVGLGLKGMDADRTGIDFRKGAFRYEHRFERLKIPLLLGAGLALLLFLQTAFWAYHDYEYHDKRAKRFARESAAVYKEFFSKDLPQGRDPMSAAKAQRDVWQGKGHGDMGRFVDYVAAVEDIGKVLSAGAGYFELEDVNLKFALRPGRQRRSGRNARPGLQGETSNLRLSTSDRSGSLKIEKQFKNASKFFNARADARPRGDQVRVTVSLDYKPEALRRLE